MAARLTDKQKQKIVADYLETGSYRATAKINGVADGTVKRIVLECGEIEQKVAEKKEQNTRDILDYMESKRDIVFEILGKGLDAINSEEKMAESTLPQITTALGTLIDKWAMIGGGSKDDLKEDGLSRSLRELGEGLESNGD